MGESFSGFLDSTFDGLNLFARIVKLLCFTFLLNLGGEVLQIDRSTGIVTDVVLFLQQYYTSFLFNQFKTMESYTRYFVCIIFVKVSDIRIDVNYLLCLLHSTEVKNIRTPSVDNKNNDEANIKLACTAFVDIIIITNV